MGLQKVWHNWVTELNWSSRTIETINFWWSNPSSLWYFMMAALQKKNITQCVHTLKKKILLCGFVIVHFRDLLSRAGTQPLGSPASSTCSLERLLTFQSQPPVQTAGVSSACITATAGRSHLRYCRRQQEGWCWGSVESSTRASWNTRINSIVK